MQDLIKKMDNPALTEEEKNDLYMQIISALTDTDAAYYCVLDPKMILEDTSIPYIIKTGKIRRALLFSEMSYAVEWCKHYNLYYNGRPLAGKLTFSEFYKMLAVALANKVATLSIDNGQNCLELYIPDIFRYTKVSFTENIIMPRVEI